MCKRVVLPEGQNMNISHGPWDEGYLQAHHSWELIDRLVYVYDTTVKKMDDKKKY